MRNSNFVSWLGHMLLGFAFFIGGLDVASMFWNTWREAMGAGALACVVGLAVIARAEMRERPKRVLRKARKALNFPTQWAVKFDKKVPQGGVLPVAVIRSDGVRFVIDIQGFAEADWNDPLDNECLLVGPRGKKFKTDPVAPLMKAAAAWGATAVLWLPEATRTGNLRQEGCNLIVVMGNARDLQHALRGAEIAPLRHEVADSLQPPSHRPPQRASMKTPELARG